MGHVISISHKGDFSLTSKFLGKLTGGRYLINVAERYAKKGVDALAAATPVDTGLTASSWGYEITLEPGRLTITWINNNLGQGWAPIALLLQYGHGTRNGGWVEGRDYINPAMRPIFDKLAEDAWEEVVR